MRGPTSLVCPGHRAGFKQALGEKAGCAGDRAPQVLEPPTRDACLTCCSGCWTLRALPHRERGWSVSQARCETSQPVSAGMALGVQRPARVPGLDQQCRHHPHSRADTSSLAVLVAVLGTRAQGGPSPMRTRSASCSKHVTAHHGRQLLRKVGACSFEAGSCSLDQPPDPAVKHPLNLEHRSSQQWQGLSRAASSAQGRISSPKPQHAHPMSPQITAPRDPYKLWPQCADPNVPTKSRHTMGSPCCAGDAPAAPRELYAVSRQPLVTALASCSDTVACLGQNPPLASPQPQCANFGSHHVKAHHGQQLLHKGGAGSSARRGGGRVPAQAATGVHGRADGAGLASHQLLPPLQQTRCQQVQAAPTDGVPAKHIPFHFC